MVKTGSSFAIWVALTIGVTFVRLAAPCFVWASLGGDVTSVEADRAKMQASLQTMSKDLYSIHEIHAPNDLVVREFVSPMGKVFGVAWQGPSRPDMRQLLGTYFEPFANATQSQKVHRVGRGPLVIQQPGLVVQMSGHVRAFSGSAYIPQMVPAGVHAEEIR
jgi:hypothetical protein